MPICPLDYRYGRPEVKRIFEEESKMRYMLQVELALLKAHATLGNIPGECVERVEKGMKDVKMERVKEIEAEIRHDIMALVKAMAEVSGECGKYIHLSFFSKSSKLSSNLQLGRRNESKRSRKLIDRDAYALSSHQPYHSAETSFFSTKLSPPHDIRNPFWHFVLENT